MLIVINGDFDTWTNATTPGTWSRSLGTGASVNRESTDKYGGGYSARFDMPVGATSGNVYQTIAMVAGAAANLSIWYKNAAGYPLELRLFNSALNVFLKSDGTWQASSNSIILPDSSGAWTSYARAFTAHASYTSYIIRVGKYTTGDMGGLSFYLDNIVIMQGNPVPIMAANYLRRRRS
jgi:hypothetical protein